ISTTISVSNLNLLTGSELTIANGGTLQVAGVITNNNGIIDATDGTVEYKGASQIVSGQNFRNRTIKNLVVSSSGGSTLNISSTPTDTLKITGALTFGNTFADLNSGNNIVLKSTETGTARVGVVAPGNTISGDFTVERYIPARRAWRFLSVNVHNGQNLHESWQEGEAPNKTNGIKGYG